MSKQTYQWRPGSRVARGLSAETVALELDRIRETNEALTPKIIVDEARPKAAPLHPAFEWNNGKAGELYREWQARHLIGAVLVKIDDENSMRAFLHVAVVPADDEEGESTGGYERTAVVVADDGMLRQALEELIARLQSAKSALEDVQKVAGKVSTKSVELRALEEIGTALLTALAIARRRKA